MATQNDLPPGWRRLVAPDGRPYYYDENTRQTSWTPPVMPQPSTLQNSAPSHSPYPMTSATPMPNTAPTPAYHSYDQQVSTQSSPNVSAAVYNQPAATGAQYTLQSLVAKTSLRQSGSSFFELERDKLLQINLGVNGQSFAWIKNGSMVRHYFPFLFFLFDLSPSVRINV